MAQDYTYNMDAPEEGIHLSMDRYTGLVENSQMLNLLKALGLELLPIYKAAQAIAALQPEEDEQEGETVNEKENN